MRRQRKAFIQFPFAGQGRRAFARACLPGLRRRSLHTLP
jgi:hypothetical protein